MAERTIVGVDFSGAQGDKNTWITEGKLNGDNLKINFACSIKRNDLTEHLKNLKGDTVAALDFPFGIPIAFAEELCPSRLEMPDLWKAVSQMCLNDFLDQRNKFVAEDKTKEFLRVGDIHIPGCYSCLHDVNPNMVPMTFYGMKMLHELWESGCKVPPVSNPADCKGTVLLETMPGAVLWSLRLPEKNSGKAYKKRGEPAQTRRKQILNGLDRRSKINLPVLKMDNSQIYRKCLENHDCLDSVVAAVGAAMWANKFEFKHPSDARVVTESVSDSTVNSRRKARGSPGLDTMIELKAALREGWIYIPESKEDTSGVG